jgi:hypothetical protein
MAKGTPAPGGPDDTGASTGHNAPLGGPAGTGAFEGHFMPVAAPVSATPASIQAAPSMKKKEDVTKITIVILSKEVNLPCLQKITDSKGEKGWDEFAGTLPLSPFRHFGDSYVHDPQQKFAEKHADFLQVRVYRSTTTNQIKGCDIKRILAPTADNAEAKKIRALIRQVTGSSKTPLENKTLSSAVVPVVARAPAGVATAAPAQLRR